MIHEYALDPEVVSQWASSDRDYAEFMREYGLGTPRIISSFPKSNISRLRRYFLRLGPADPDSIQGKRYLEMVLKIIEALIIRTGQQIQGDNWAENITTENGRLPFDVVLSAEAIDTEQNITPGNMYVQDSLWHHSHQKNFNRTIDDFSSVVKGMLRLSTDKIVIVDAYGWTTEAIQSMQHLINSIILNRVNPQLPSVILYYKEKHGGTNTGVGSPGANYVKSQIMEGVDDDLSGIELQIVELRETGTSDVFHNRCILTEHGGIITGHGIGVSGNDAHTDEALLMELDIYEKKWRQFVEDNHFEVISHST